MKKKVKKTREISKKTKKEDFNFKEEYSKAWNFLKESKNYIYFIVGVFFILAIIGFFFNDIVDLLYNSFFGQKLSEVILDYVEKLILETQGMSHKELMGFIFLNNIQSSISGMIFGVLYCFMPIISAVFNGYVLGFIALLSIKEQGFLILWKILPHGIFELPAVFIALGLGVRLGYYFIKKVDNFFKGLFFLLFCFFISCISFGVIMLIFNFVSYLVSGTISFGYNPIDASNSVLLFLIFSTILTISFLVGLFIFENKESGEIKRLIINSLRVLLLVVFPLLIIAAIIEGTLIALSS